MLMKKIITLILSLTAVLASWAQGFVFQYQGQSLADGATVIIAAEEDLFGDLSCETNNPMNPDDGLILKLLTTTSATASATLQISYNSLDANVLQWCMGDGCMPLDNLASVTKRFTVRNGSEQVQFDAVGIQNEGYLSATLKVTIGLESHQVNIMFANGDVDAIQALPQSRGTHRTYYDLHGRRLQTPSAGGLYIIKDGEQVRKVAIQ